MNKLILTPEASETSQLDKSIIMPQIAYSGFNNIIKMYDYDAQCCMIKHS